MLKSIQYGQTEYRLDSIGEAFGVLGREYLLALNDDNSSHSRSLLRELGDDVTITGLFLTLSSFALDFRKGIETMGHPADAEIIKLYDELQKTFGDDGAQGPGKSKSAYYKNTTRWEGLTKRFEGFSNDYQPNASSCTVRTQNAMLAAGDGTSGSSTYATAVQNGTDMTAKASVEENLTTINAITDPNKRLTALLEFQKDTGPKTGPRKQKFKMAFLFSRQHGVRTRQCNYCGNGTSQGPHSQGDCMGRVYDLDNQVLMHLSETQAVWFKKNGISPGPPRSQAHVDEAGIRIQMARTNFQPGMPKGDVCFASRDDIFAEARFRMLPRSEQRQRGGRGRGGGGGGRGGYGNQTTVACNTQSTPSPQPAMQAATSQQPAMQATTMAAAPATQGAESQITELHAMVAKLTEKITAVQANQKQMKKDRKKAQAIDWSADDTDDDTDDE